MREFAEFVGSRIYRMREFAEFFIPVIEKVTQISCNQIKKNYNSINSLIL